MDRTYWLYLPDNLQENAPLVILLHGYKASAEGYRPEMIQVAQENGFALCYPQGAVDGRGILGSTGTLYPRRDHRVASGKKQGCPSYI